MIKKVFYSLVAVFVLIIIFFMLPFETFFPVLAVLGLLLFLFGLLLVHLARNSKRKLFLYMTGISAAAVFPSLILHNLIYALFIVLFGENFWQGGDEPFFFIVGIIIAPIGFIVGVIGTLIRREIK